MSSQQQTARRLSSAFQQGVTRRRFLKWGLVGSAGVAAAAAGGFALLRLSPLDDRPKPDWAGGLSRQEYHLFDRARVALLPTVGTDLTPSDQVPVVLLDGREHDSFRVDEERLRADLARP